MRYSVGGILRLGAKHMPNESRIPERKHNLEEYLIIWVHKYFNLYLDLCNLGIDLPISEFRFKVNFMRSNLSTCEYTYIIIG
jgi:hypothetical protein